MKKLIFVFLIFISFNALFAKSYKIVSFEGKVTFESVDGWKSVFVGQNISNSNLLNTSLNSNVTIEDEDGTTFVIKAMQNGTVDELITLNSKKNIKSKKIKGSSVADSIERSSKGVATASSRASEAKSDLDWNE